MKKNKTVKNKNAPVKIDLACGDNKKEGFYGVDIIKFPSVDLVHDLKKKWPWADNSIEEFHCSHYIEHLTNLDNKWERIHFFNELYRCLQKEGKATIIFPHWASMRYYGDPSHKEPFSEFGFYYLSKEWRLGDKNKKDANGQPLGANAPHTDISYVDWGYDCDFSATWGYSLHQEVAVRNQEYQMFAMTFYKEACQDIIATLIKK